jgi:hypothetical protein
MQGVFAFTMKEEKNRKLIYTMSRECAFRLLYLCYYL